MKTVTSTDLLSPSSDPDVAHSVNKVMHVSKCCDEYLNNRNISLTSSRISSGNSYEKKNDNAYQNGCLLLLQDEPDCYCRVNAATLCRSIEEQQNKPEIEKVIINDVISDETRDKQYFQFNNEKSDSSSIEKPKIVLNNRQGFKCQRDLVNEEIAHEKAGVYTFNNDGDIQCHFLVKKTALSQTSHNLMDDDKCSVRKYKEDKDKALDVETTGLSSRSSNLVFCEKDCVYVTFLKSHTCFDLIPTSGKVLVLDSELTIRKAFYALVFNNTRAALISSGSKTGTPKFTGVISISDFIELVTLYYRSKYNTIRELDELSIRSWKNQLNSNAVPRSFRALPGIAGGGATRHLISISPDLSLFDTCMLIEKERIHRVPVICPNTNDFLYFVTLKRILRFLFLAIYKLPRPHFLDKTIDELGIGTYCIDKCFPYIIDTIDRKSSRCYKKIYTINDHTSVIDALRLLVRTGVSALPIVDTTYRLRDLFSRFDVIHLAVTGLYTDLDQPVSDALKKRGKRIEAVLCCQLEESLITIMVRMVVGQVHRLVIVDKSRRVIGILSLSDLISFLSRMYTK